MLVICVIILSFMLPANKAQQLHDCTAGNFELQPNFEHKKFQGTWYTISANNHKVIELPNFLKANFIQKNVKSFYRYLTNKTMEIKTSGSLYGDRCYYAQGLAYPQNNDTRMLEIDMFVKRAQLRPMWIVATNYTGYAVMYACWNILGDGTCDPDNVFVYSMNRVREGHTEAELLAVDAAVLSTCVNPSSLTPVVQEVGVCDFDPYNFPRKVVGPGR